MNKERILNDLSRNKKLKPPKTNIQEILLTLITYGDVSIKDFPYLSGYRTRVSELENKHGLQLYTENHTGVNKFGNSYTFVKHCLHITMIKDAVSLYKKLTNEL